MHTTDNPMNLNVSQWWPTHVNRTRVGYHIEPRLVSIDYLTCLAKLGMFILCNHRSD